jgi:hypothetical protein
MAESLSYANHRRFHPPFHFFAVPVLAANALLQLWFAIRHPLMWIYWWSVLVTVAVVTIGLLARFYALRVQDRVIRLEETLRLLRVLPAEMQPRVGELSTGDLIGLRFAPDAELPGIVTAIYAGECKGREAVKRRIQGAWREDRMRI